MLIATSFIPNWAPSRGFGRLALRAFAERASAATTLPVPGPIKVNRHKRDCCNTHRESGTFLRAHSTSQEPPNQDQNRTQSVSLTDTTPVVIPVVDTTQCQLCR